MNKLILLISILYINLHANKNWIPINTQTNGLKMTKPSPSLIQMSQKKTTKKQKMNLIDARLINSIREIQDLVKQYK